MKLQRFKTIQIAKLNQIKLQYAENARVQEIVDLHLIPKLQHLRQMDLADYIFSLYLSSREYSVFEELMPTEQEVDMLIADKSKLYAFKAKYLCRLMRLRRELKAKYPSKSDRVENIVFELASRLANLRRHMLTDYLFTVTLACKEFTEFCQLVPTENEIKTLFVVPEEG
jgi:hypothetical protein